MRAILAGAALLVLAQGPGCKAGDSADGRGGEGAGAASLLELAQTPAACETDADCCVVYESCQARAYVVLAADFEAARELAANAPRTDCVRCLPPAVAVRCLDHACGGVELGPDDPAFEASLADHCGPAVEAGAAAGAAPSTPERVFGCGS